ncbi:uncharacterized protein K444DRAFT_670555 [Hyaloscypha bicolor E]|uniref:Heterokaryon incompatibility domain-containing protein n=1 Tax=Hyaloscypha bicolor E TaxID=1095630 RepID=A0A2J6SFY6_9HELO|nr:uncharacterized protein K444DRAFT_670555 [Hyaloscypha bicolor E]PMD49667.1 hypothetical protein K444DRAFT_670555 [Hyaloscypha bicolor E]
MAQPDNTDAGVQEGEAAGEKILALCTKIAPEYRDLSDFEDAMVDEFCAVGTGADRVAFMRSVIQGLKFLLRKGRYKIVLVLLQKLKGLSSPRSLKAGDDILPFAIASCFRRDTTPCDKEEMKWQMWGPSVPVGGKLIEVVQLLLENGADVRAFDNHGNTALFYACMLGHCKLFRILLEEGAEISTTHTFVSWRDVTSLNLVQTTLEAIVWQEVETPKFHGHPWNGKLGGGWRQIVSDLLDAGISCSRDEPHMVKLLHAACFRGETSWVERLIAYGVPIDHPTVLEYSRGRFYASALHAAAAGGQAHVVQLLLDLGARPRDMGQSTCEQLDWEATRSPHEDPPRKTHNKPALGIAICATHSAAEGVWSSRRHRGIEGLTWEKCSKRWETCRVLLEVESRTEDRAQMLELSAQCGHVSLVKHLLQMGSRLDRVPVTKSFETIELLIQHGSEFDAAQAQRYAARKSECALLHDLFQKWGNLVPPDELGQLATTAIGEGDIEMLDVLVSFLNINEAFRVRTRRTDRDKKNETLIQIACRSGSMATINFLIERGANMGCLETGIGNNALTTIGKRLKTQIQSTDRLWELWNFVQLLERHMPEEGQKMREQWRVKAQCRAPIHTVITNKDQVLDLGIPIDSHNPETKSLLPIDRIIGQDFVHTPLTGRDGFRTLILHAATDSGFLIECELVSSDLSLAPDYEALSYVWGDNSVPRYIKLDSKVLQITPNLYEALLAFRLESKPRHLWVDAICINQCDIGERNQQVTLMRDIYMNASRVLVWLGKSGEDSHLVFQHHAQWRQEYKLRGSPVEESNPPAYKGSTLTAFHRLCQRPWFFRTWVIQEKALSKAAIVCCGSDSAAWNDIFRPLIRHIEPAYYPIRGLDYQIRARQLHDLHGLRDAGGTGPGAYRSVLKYSQFSQATDPKDKVYGIFGLLKRGLMSVEYGLDVQEIYCKFTQAIIQEAGSLDLLNLCGTKHTIPGLPSWVPDFSARRSSCHLPGHTESLHHGKWEWLDSCLTKASPGLRFRNDDMELIIKGKAVDTVRFIGNELPASKEYALGTDACLRLLLGWESLAASAVSTKDSEIGRMSVDPRTTASDVFGWSPIGGVLWYKQYGTGALGSKEPQYFEDVEYCTELGLGGVDESSLQKTCERYYRSYVNEFEKASYGRKLFVTEGGSLGLADPEVQPGDKIVYLPGSTYPFAVRLCEGDTSTLLGDCYVHGLDVIALFGDPERPLVEYIFR